MLSDDGVMDTMHPSEGTSQEGMYHQEVSKALELWVGLFLEWEIPLPSFLEKLSGLIKTYHLEKLLACAVPDTRAIYFDEQTWQWVKGVLSLEKVANI